MKLDDIVIDNVKTTTIYEEQCPNCGWRNSSDDLICICPECGKDLKCGQFTDINSALGINNSDIVEKFKATNDIELAEMFGITIEELHKEIENKTFRSVTNNDNIFIFPVQNDKPVKIVIEDNVKVSSVSDYDIEIKKKFNSLETEKLLKDIFGDTNIATYDCSDMSDEEIDRIVNKWNDIGCTSLQLTPKELKEILKEQ